MTAIVMTDEDMAVIRPLPRKDTQMSEITPADILARIGKTLHGEDQWRMRLARDIGVDDDTIRRWMTGRTPLRADHGVFDDAMALMRRRAAEISARADEVERWLLQARRTPGAAIAAPAISLSHRQAKTADRLGGIELIVPYPAGLTRPRLDIDEEVDATAEEAAWAHRALAGHGDLQVTAVRVVRLKRPTGLPREEQVETHLAILLIGRRWLSARTAAQPRTMWLPA